MALCTAVGSIFAPPVFGYGELIEADESFVGKVIGKFFNLSVFLNRSELSWPPWLRSERKKTESSFPDFSQVVRRTFVGNFGLLRNWRDHNVRILWRGDWLCWCSGRPKLDGSLLGRSTRNRETFGQRNQGFGKELFAAGKAQRIVGQAARPIVERAHELGLAVRWPHAGSRPSPLLVRNRNCKFFPHPIFVWSRTLCELLAPLDHRGSLQISRLYLRMYMPLDDSKFENECCAILAAIFRLSHLPTLFRNNYAKSADLDFQISLWKSSLLTKSTRHILFVNMAR